MSSVVPSDRPDPDQPDLRTDSPDTVVLDLDGTLVDTVYLHVVAWQGAFREVGLNATAVRIHDAIGMGGDRLVAAVAGEAAETAVGDAVRSAHEARFAALLPHVQALPGASELVEYLHQDHHVVLATSGNAEVTDSLLSVLDGRWGLHAVLDGSSVERSKPAPDVIRAALDAVGGTQAVVVGDAVWDALAARAAGMPSIGLRSGGIADERLKAAGAVAVYDDPEELLRHLRSAGWARDELSGSAAP